MSTPEKCLSHGVLVLSCPFFSWCSCCSWQCGRKMLVQNIACFQPTIGRRKGNYVYLEFVSSMLGFSSTHLVSSILPLFLSFSSSPLFLLPPTLLGVVQVRAGDEIFLVNVANERYLVSNNYCGHIVVL